jgi:transcriptional regulator with XRE-family HTH domain
MTQNWNNHPRPTKKEQSANRKRRQQEDEAEKAAKAKKESRDPSTKNPQPPYDPDAPGTVKSRRKKNPESKKTERRTPTERVQSLARIAEMDRKGYTQVQIAEAIGVSESQISQDLRQIRLDYRNSYRWEYEERVEEKLQQLREVRKEAWEAWERSKLPVTKKTSRSVAPLRVGKKGKRQSDEDDEVEFVDLEDADNPLLKLQLVETVEVVEQRLPASEYLTIVLKTYEAERDILGLDAAKKIDITTMTIDWEALAKRREKMDEVEKKIQAVEALVHKESTQQKVTLQDAEVIEVNKEGDFNPKRNGIIDLHNTPPVELVDDDAEEESEARDDWEAQ